MTGAPSSRHNDGVRVILSITSIKLACHRRAGDGARGRVAGFSLQALPPHPPNNWLLQGSMGKISMCCCCRVNLPSTSLH